MAAPKATPGREWLAELSGPTESVVIGRLHGFAPMACDPTTITWVCCASENHPAHMCKLPHRPLWAHAGNVDYSHWHEIDGGRSAAVRPAQQIEQCGQGSVGTGGRGRRGGSDAALDRRQDSRRPSESLGSANRRSGTDTGGVPSVPEPEIATISAALLPSHWTEELAADFTASLDAVARRMALYVWRSGTAGIHRRALCQRTELAPAELSSLLMRMGHALRRFQRERGLTLSRPVAANSRLQSYFVDPDFASVAAYWMFGEGIPDQPADGAERP